MWLDPALPASLPLRGFAGDGGNRRRQPNGGDVEAKVHDLMRVFVYGAFDFILTPEERHMFLEVKNAIGEITAVVLPRAFEAMSASSKNLRLACAQHAASMIGPDLRSVL